MDPRFRGDDSGGDVTQLYLISPPQISLSQFLSELEGVLSTRLVSVFQLRLKDIEASALRQVIAPIRDLCHAHGVPIILNDHAHLAAELNCDGVHLGQQDMKLIDARKILGAHKSIGITCHNSKHLAMVAAEQGADYVAFGAFYPTKTKDSGYRAEIDLLRDWSELTTVPCVAIGGITPGNCKPLVDAGADFIAVVSAVWEHPNGAKAGVEAFKEYID